MRPLKQKLDYSDLQAQDGLVQTPGKMKTLGGTSYPDSFWSIGRSVLVEDAKTQHAGSKRKETARGWAEPIAQGLFRLIVEIISPEGKARAMSPWGMEDPPLEDVVGGIVRFMRRRGLLESPRAERVAERA